MEFIVINKSVTPPKVSRLESISTHEAIKSIKDAGIEKYSLFCNVSDSEISLLLTQTKDLQKRVTELEKAIQTVQLSMQSVQSPENDIDSQPTRQPIQSKSISVQLTKKSLQLSNSDAGIYQDSLLFSIALSNLTPKHIRAVKGDLVFSDLFDADIFRVGITVNEKIKPKALVKWDGVMPYNQFIPEHVHFAGYAPEDLKVRLDNESVVYL